LQAWCRFRYQIFHQCFWATHGEYFLSYFAFAIVGWRTYFSLNSESYRSIKYFSPILRIICLSLIYNFWSAISEID
jgi:hypothetical protein